MHRSSHLAIRGAEIPYRLFGRLGGSGCLYRERVLLVPIVSPNNARRKGKIEKFEVIFMFANFDTQGGDV